MRMITNQGVTMQVRHLVCAAMLLSGAALLSACASSRVAMRQVSVTAEAHRQVEMDSVLNRRMYQECDSFLAALPRGLQARQAAAVRAAQAGDCTALNAIRRGRNAAPVVDERVGVVDVRPDLRLFTPQRKAQGKRRLVLYLHGGGWAFGSINSCTAFCVALALQADCCVAALNYRLAPEHPFPAALNDCEAAVRWLQSQAEGWGCDATTLAIGGDSAGGNLALATALSGVKVDALFPIYPVTKVFDAPSASWQRYAEGYGCDADLLSAFNAAYAQGQADHALASVALASDAQLRQLPRTLFLSAGRDILLDQTTELANRLCALQVDVQQYVLPGATHLFITVPGQPTAFQRAVELVARFLQGQPLAALP